MGVVLRRLRSEDISQVVAIEKVAFSPLWTGTPFKRELNNRYASYLVACSIPEPDDETPPQPESSGEGGLSWRLIKGRLRNLVGRDQPVKSDGGVVAGYVSIWHQGDEAHIIEIAVQEKLRGRGIGELLLIGSLRVSLEYGSKIMSLEVRVSNFVAQRLYEKYGFKSVGIRKAYYSDNREDAVIMNTNPIDSDDYQQVFQELQEAYRGRWGEIEFSP